MDASLPLTNFDYYIFILCYSYITVKWKELSEGFYSKLFKRALKLIRTALQTLYNSIFH